MPADLCPHCSRPLLSRTAPRCAFCGKPIAEGALSWEQQEKAAVQKHVDDIERAAALNLTDDGFDQAGRERAIKQLRSLLLPKDTRKDLLERFRKGLARDFSPERAAQQTVCRCDHPADVMVSVEWIQSWEGDRQFGAANAALLLAGVVSWQRDVVTSTFVTHAGSCAVCAKKRLVFDRFERFFGEVPKEFKLGASQVTPRSLG